MMDFKERSRFRRMAYDALVERFGNDGINMLSPAVLERLMLAEAATLVMAQVRDEFAPAQEMIRAVIFEA